MLKGKPTLPVGEGRPVDLTRMFWFLLHRPNPRALAMQATKQPSEMKNILYVVMNSIESLLLVLTD